MTFDFDALKESSAMAKQFTICMEQWAAGVAEMEAEMRVSASKVLPANEDLAKLFDLEMAVSNTEAVKR